MYSESQPGHIDAIRQVNAGMVYRLIDLHGPVSRIGLSRLAQLAPASITRIIREMMDARLVRECEIPGLSRRGRPATGLELASEDWQFLSLHLCERRLLLTLRDLSGKAVTETEKLMPEDPGVFLPDHLLTAIGDFFACNYQLLERVTTIAITLDGVINAATGVVERMAYYQVTNLPLAGIIGRKTGLRIYLHHTVQARMLAEYYFGAGKGANDIIQLITGTEIDVAVMTDGQLLHNKRSLRPQAGHIRTEFPGRRCHCGNEGCLETVAGSRYLLQKAAQSDTDLPGICQSALSGNKDAAQLITATGMHLGRMLATLASLFHPQYILIDSPLNSAEKILFPAIEAEIKRRLPAAGNEIISVRKTEFSQQTTLPGAALVKEALYNGELLLQLLQG